MEKFKVKIPFAGKLKTNRLTNVLIVTVATIFLLIIVKILISDKEEFLPASLQRVFHSGTSDTDEESAPVVKVPLVKLTESEASRELRKLQMQSKGIDLETQSYKVLQKRLLNDFQNLAQIKVNLPGHLHYTNADPEEGIAGVYGTSLDDSESFAMLAARGEISQEKVLQFLSENNGAIPMLEGHRILVDQAFTEQAPPQTGLGTLTIYPASTVGDQGLFAVVAPRLDGKGTYLFLRKAEKSTFEANEGGFDQMLLEMRAQP